MIIMIYYAEEGLFRSDTYSNHEIWEMVAVIYVALICNLVVFLIPKKLDIEESLEEEITESILRIDLNTLTITTLKALAKAKGIKNYTQLGKTEIIDLLK